MISGATDFGVAAAAAKRKTAAASMRRLYARAGNFLIDGDEKAKRTFIFAHGAGGPMRSAWMAAVARGIAANGNRVVRFEFPYMAAKKKVPDREPVLLESWREAIRTHVATPSAAKRSTIAAEGGGATFIGG